MKAGAHKITKYALKDVDESGSPRGSNADISIRVSMTCTTVKQDIIVDLNEDIVPGELDKPDSPDDPSRKQPTVEGDGFSISKAIISPEAASPDDPYPVVVDITAINGIINLEVAISSGVLNEDTLANVGLGKDFDLAHPEELKGVLEGLGFPVGEDVTRKIELIFNITKFIGLLTVLNPDAHSFIITVVDTGNDKTTETLTPV